MYFAIARNESFTKLKYLNQPRKNNNPEIPTSMTFSFVFLSPVFDYNPSKISEGCASK